MPDKSRKSKKKLSLSAGDELMYEVGLSQDIGSNTWIKATFGIRRPLLLGEKPSEILPTLFDSVESTLMKRFMKLKKEADSD